MKYLVTLDSFKSLKYETRTLTNELRPIREQFENDITFGGSLIGRFINSTVRVLGIRFKAAFRIDPLIDEFKKHLGNLLTSVSSLSEREKARNIRARLLLEQIYKVVISESMSLEEKLQALLSVEDYKKVEERKSGEGTPITDSYKYKNRIDKLYEDVDDDNNPEENIDESGLIDIALRDIKSCEIKNKEELIKKLERFKELLMEIVLEDKKDTKKKYSIYSNTRRFLESYLDIIRQIESNSVKQRSPLKQGDFVMWKSGDRTKKDSQQIAKGKDKLHLGQIIRNVSDYATKIKVRDFDTDETIMLDIEKVLPLTYFDEEYYKKMGEKNDIQIREKIAKARIGYYVFLYKKDRTKASFYQGEIKRLQETITKSSVSEYGDLESQDSTDKKPKADAGVSSTTTDKKDSEPVNASYSYFEDIDLLFEEANVILSGKAQIAAWGYIVDAYSDIKKTTDMKAHTRILSELLEGKLNVSNKNELGKVVRRKISALGREIYSLLTSEYKPVSIQDLKNFTKEKSTGGPQNENYNLITEAAEDDDDIKKEAVTICKLARAILALGEDMSLANAFRDSQGEGVSESILKMIASFKDMKKAVEESKNEKAKFITKYSEFRLITEAEEDDDEGTLGEGTLGEDEEGNDDEGQGDEEVTETDGEDTLDKVEIAWFVESAGGKGPFKKGEEKEWVVEEEEVKEPIGPEKGKIVVQLPEGELKKEPKIDPIIKILNIFGKAYSLYATDYIPSGRPEGRVSQRTLLEYKYIGKDNEGVAKGPKKSDYFTPDYGPWAAKRIFDKWNEGVMSILENPDYRKILANVEYVSMAEKETGTEQAEQSPEKSSGITLLRFITEMLTLRGTFEDNKRTLMLKYFNADSKSGEDFKPRNNGPKISKSDAAPSDEPFFIPVKRYLGNSGSNAKNVIGWNFIKSDYFYLLKVQQGSNIKFMILWSFVKDSNTILFRMQESTDKTKFLESMIHTRFAEPNFTYKMKNLQDGRVDRNLRMPLKLDKTKQVNVLGFKSDQAQSFQVGKDIKFYIKKNDAEVETSAFTPETYKILEIYVMITTEPSADQKSVVYKPVEVNWKEAYKSTNDRKLASYITSLRKQMV